MPDYLDTAQGRRIAYHRTAGAGAGIIFLGGFVSDMQGTKALHFEAFAKAQRRPYLRFDYSGHGQSSGQFTDGCIGDWAEDAAAVLDMAEGPQVLVGSSMGGWIALLLARRHPQRIKGLVTIAAAPDFTEDGFWQGFSPDQQMRLMRDGQITLPSDYSPEGYRITRRLIEDGRQHLLLRAPLDLPFPVRFLQGSADQEVSVALAQRLFDHASGPDISLTLVKGADHRFSSPHCLALAERAILEVS